MSRDSLDDIAASVDGLQKAVARQKAALQLAEKNYNEKVALAADLKERAVRFVQAGNDEAAKSSLAQMRTVIAVLPQFEDKFNFAQFSLDENLELLSEQRLALSQMELQQEMSASDLEVTKALEAANAQAGASSDAARKRFERSQKAIQGRNNVATAMSSLNFAKDNTERQFQDLGADDMLAAIKADVVQEQIEGDTNA